MIGFPTTYASLPPGVFTWDDDTGDDDTMPPTNRMDTPTRDLWKEMRDLDRKVQQDSLEEQKRHNLAAEAKLEAIHIQLKEQPSRREWTWLAGLFLGGMAMLLVFFISLYVTRQGDDAAAAWRNAASVVPH